MYYTSSVVVPTTVCCEQFPFTWFPPQKSHLNIGA